MTTGTKHLRAAWLIGVCLLMGESAMRSVLAAASFAAGVNVGNVNTSAINEASGIVGSRTNAGVFWVNNDSGDSARIFALDSQARLLGTYNLTGFGAVDYEDIAIGPGPVAGVDYIYIGDIGDNNAVRSSVALYRIPEPAVYARQHSTPVTRSLKGIAAITMSYPDGARNAETLLSDPWTGDVYICTKIFGNSRVYRAAAADLNAGGPVTMTYVGQFSSLINTGGAISPTGGEILIRLYYSAKLYPRSAGESVIDALTGSGTSIPLASEPQGEAIGFDSVGLDYYTLSEGVSQPLYHYARTSGDGPDVPTTWVAAGSTWKYLDDGSDQGTAWRSPGFDDSSWSAGDGQFGYGDGDEETTVSYGGDPNDKHVTTYFRHAFESTTGASELTLRLLFDDGAAVYLNGAEVLRQDLALGAAYDTLASAERSDLEDAWTNWSIDPSLLFDGTNVIAVEVHQYAVDDPDVSFDLQLLGLPGPSPPTHTPTATPTDTATATATATITPTATNTPASALVGRIQFHGRTDHTESVTVRLQNQATLTVRQELVQTDANGDFTILGVDDATYDITAEAASYLRARVDGVIVSGGAGVVDFGTVFGGDLDASNCIDFQDLPLLSSAFGTSVGDPGYNEGADINRSGAVDFTDLPGFSAGYGSCGHPPVQN